VRERGEQINASKQVRILCILYVATLIIFLTNLPIFFSILYNHKN
jgi:hypothetical protein